MFTGIVSHIGRIEKISHPKDWELAISVQKSLQSDQSFDFDKLLEAILAFETATFQ